MYKSKPHWIERMRREVYYENTTNPTKIKSEFQTTVENMLDKLGIPYDTKELSLNLIRPDGRALTFKPDITTGDLDGKTVLLEPHGSKFFDHGFMYKLRTFMRSEHHEKYHLVLITENTFIDYVRKAFNETHLTAKKISDDFWMLPRDPAKPYVLENELMRRLAVLNKKLVHKEPTPEGQSSA